MAAKKLINKGLVIGTQNVNGGEVYNAVRDIHVYQNKKGLSLQDFQALLNQLRSEINASNLPPGDKQDLTASVETALNQSKKSEPRKSLILGPLSTALEILTQAGGAAKAVEALLPLLNKAITFAQNLF